MKNTRRFVVEHITDENGKTLKLIGRPFASVYRPRIERGAIVLPIENARRAKAQAKRERRAAKRSENANRGRVVPA